MDKAQSLGDFEVSRFSLGHVRLFACSLRFHSSTLKFEALYPFEISLEFNQTSRHYIPEGRTHPN
jgi:hypothetical protein